MGTFLAVLVATCVLVIVIVWRSVSGNKKDNDVESFLARDTGAGNVGELIHDNTLAQNELREFSDQVIEKIDLRINTLKKLIKEADDRIDSLESMAAPKPEPKKQRPAPPRDSQFIFDGAPAPPSSGRPNMQLSRRTAILSLSRKGLTAEQIAKEVGMNRAEIDFILNIEKQRRK
jgi:hypothetical protein